MKLGGKSMKKVGNVTETKNDSKKEKPYRYLALDTCTIVPLMELHQIRCNQTDMIYNVKRSKYLDEKGEFKPEVAKMIKEEYNTPCPRELIDLYKLIECGVIRPVCLKGVYEELIKGVPFARQKWAKPASEFIRDLCYIGNDYTGKYWEFDDKIKRRAELYCKEYSDGYAPMKLMRVLENTMKSEISKLIGSIAIDSCTYFEADKIMIANIVLIRLANSIDKILDYTKDEARLKRWFVYCITHYKNGVSKYLNEENKAKFSNACDSFLYQMSMGKWILSNDAMIMAEASVKGFPLLTCNGQDFVFFNKNYGPVRREYVQGINEMEEGLGDGKFNPGAYDVREMTTILSTLVNQKRKKSQKNIPLNDTDFTDLDALIGKEDVANLDPKVCTITTPEQYKKLKNDRDGKQNTDDTEKVLIK